MLLPKLNKIMTDRKISPEKLAKQSGKLFSNMTIRRICEGKSTSKLIASAIAKTLKVKLSELE